MQIYELLRSSDQNDNACKFGLIYDRGPRAELGDIFERYQHLLENLPKEHKKIINEIIGCRTPLLGGHKYKCDNCGYEMVLYNSCYNRHCPKCQDIEKIVWMEARKDEILKVPYFHVVFPLPDLFDSLVLSNKEVIYRILFKSSAEALKSVLVRDSEVKIGLLSLLHTWGGNLSLHPHIHSMVPGCGLSVDKSRLIQCSESFFVSGETIADGFQEKFLAQFHKAYKRGELVFYGENEGLYEKANFEGFLKEAKDAKWEVYLKKAEGGAKQVLEYIAKYRFKVAIENKQILNIEDGMIRFHYKDYDNQQSQTKVMTLTAQEFMRRFLLHSLPSEFKKVRYYGIFAGPDRNLLIALCQKFLGQSEKSIEGKKENKLDLLKRITGFDARQCPKCKTGHLIEDDLSPTEDEIMQIIRGSDSKKCDFNNLNVANHFS